jgi:hypothetical protein
MTRIILIVLVFTAILLAPRRAAAQGLPKPTLTVDFGVPKVKPAPRLPASRRVPASHGHGMTAAPGTKGHELAVPAVDCRMRVLTTSPESRPKLRVHVPQHGTEFFIHVVPVMPCPPEKK